MDVHPIFVLFDLYGNFEQREEDRLGLSLCQRCALQSQLAQLLVQHVGCRRQQLATKVDAEVRSDFRSHLICLIQFSVCPRP